MNLLTCHRSTKNHLATLKSISSWFSVAKIRQYFISTKHFGKKNTI